MTNINVNEKVDDRRLNVVYRPKRFDEVVGQKKAIKTLKGSIKENRVQNAYIFEGDTGSGKTTTARIFSNALICRNRTEDDEPCGECESCQTFKTKPSLVDVIEIDAGENRGIDKIRELKETLKYPPKEGYRVVIIDEAHMLTKESTTALLKPIEEPPVGTIFLLLTTESEKIIKTIRNRCIRLRFTKLPLHLVVGRLREIAIENNISVEDGVLEKIAVASEGIMREAITLLEQVSIMVNDRKIKEEDLLGLINIEEQYIKKILMLILKRDIVGVMDCIDCEEDSISEADFDYIISRLRRYLYEDNLSVDTSKLISQMINVFMEYKNKVIYNISLKTLVELSSIDCIGLCSNNESSAEYLLNRFEIQDKDIFDMALEKGKKKYSQIEEDEENDISKKESDKEDVSMISLNKTELFMSLMSIKFRDFEYRFKDCSLEITEDKVVNFMVDTMEQKKDMTGFLKREYAQSLKPICDIEGFLVKVRQM